MISSAVMVSGLAGVGLGWRSELAGDLLATPRVVDFIEVVAETCMVHPRQRDQLAALTHVWPVAVHGVKLSLGSAHGIDVDRAKQLGAVAKALRAPVISEHVAFVRGRDREIGHLTPLPRTRAAVAVVARNVATARRHLPDVPLLLENVACTLDWPDNDFDEPTFYHEVVAATDCDLLLDLSNLWANAVNHGHDPAQVLAAFPLDRVAMVHVAGGAWDDGFYFDTHAAPITAPVVALLHELRRRRGPVPVLLERDAGFGPFSDLVDELETLRVHEFPTEHPPTTAVVSPQSPLPPALDPALAAQQDLLADALASSKAPTAAAVATFGAAALARSRNVLQRKRVDDALPLVPRIAGFGPLAYEFAGRVLADVPRPPYRVAAADALRIALAAQAHEALAAAAHVDALLLRARFRGPDRDGLVHPRHLPFIGSTTILPHTFWAVKGPGAAATIRLSRR